MKARLARWKRLLVLTYKSMPLWKAILYFVPVSLCALRIRGVPCVIDPQSVKWSVATYEARLKMFGRRDAAEFARHVAGMWYGL